MAWKLVLDQVNRYRNQEAKFPCRSIERCSFQKKTSSIPKITDVS